MTDHRLKPVLLSILLCDLIIRDEMTRKLSLIGLFNHIGARQFPIAHGRMAVFVSLTDGHGTSDGELRLVHRATERTLVTLEGKVVFPNPKATIELSFHLDGVKFPEPGEYSFDFYCDDELVGSRPFLVTVVPPPGPAGRPVPPGGQPA